MKENLIYHDSLNPFMVATSQGLIIETAGDPLIGNMRTMMDG